MKFFRNACVAALLTILMVPHACSAQHARGGGLDNAPFSGIVSFGDSLSDTGNLFRLTQFPQAPYFEGRASNGILWNEYLALSMGMLPCHVENYAVGGATTGRDNFNDSLVTGLNLPGLLDQIDQFEHDLAGRRADPRKLFTLWAGSNDFFLTTDPFQTIPTAVGNTRIAIERLHRLGARRILVVNLPDLGLTPFGRSTDPVGLSMISAGYNQVLELMLDQLESEGISTVRLDVASLLQAIVAQPDNFGFSNATDPLLYSGDLNQTFLFWDEVHPTTIGHLWIALSAREWLSESYRKVWIRRNSGSRPSILFLP